MQSVPSLLLPTDGDAPLAYRGLTVTLLPKLAFFALWDVTTERAPSDAEHMAPLWMCCFSGR